MAATSTTGTAAPSVATKETHGPVATGALLAFTAGFVDTCGFIALFGLFTAHVTGNFVLIGAAIADPHQGLIGKLLALPVFVAVVAATHLFVLHRQRRSRAAVGPVLVGQIVFLTLFLQGDVPPASRERLLEYQRKAHRQRVPVYWTAEHAADSRVRALCHLVLTLPEFQLD